MKPQDWYALAADAVLVVHASIVLFIVGGLLLIFAGKLFSWRWVSNPWFRLGHLMAIIVVVLQSWAGMICPLTTWEMELRQLAGESAYAGSFIQHWLHRLIFYRAPNWVFALVYTLFAALVLWSWFLVRPRSFRD